MKNLLGGLAGALALNLLHEVYKRIDADAPRIDLVGEEALTKSIKAFGVEPPHGTELFAATMAADIVSNALYYSLAGQGSNDNTVLRGAGLGLAAGVGALTLTKPLGLNDAPVNRKISTSILTVAWYLAGGLVAGYAIKALRNDND